MHVPDSYNLPPGTTLKHIDDAFGDPKNEVTAAMIDSEDEHGQLRHETVLQFADNYSQEIWELMQDLEKIMDVCSLAKNGYGDSAMTTAKNLRLSGHCAIIKRWANYVSDAVDEANENKE